MYICIYMFLSLIDSWSIHPSPSIHPRQGKKSRQGTKLNMLSKQVNERDEDMSPRPE